MQQDQEQIRNAEQNAKALESVLSDYSRYVNAEQAKFLKNYLRSLQLDMESALTRGDNHELQIIVEDIESLKKGAFERLAERHKDTTSS